MQDVPCQEVTTWKAKPGVDVMFHPGNAIAFVAFNWTRPLWQDHRVREAVARAIDRGPIGAGVCPLARTPRHYYLEQVAWAFNPDAIAPELDPAEAERLLDEAGYPRGADGVRLRIGLAYRSLYAHYGVRGAHHRPSSWRRSASWRPSKGSIRSAGSRASRTPPTSTCCSTAATSAPTRN